MNSPDSDMGSPKLSVKAEEINLSDTAFIYSPKIGVFRSIDEIRSRSENMLASESRSKEELLTDLQIYELRGKPSKGFKEAIKHTAYYHLKEFAELMSGFSSKNPEKKEAIKNIAVEFALKVERQFAIVIQALDIAGTSYGIIKNNPGIDNILKQVLSLMIKDNSDKIINAYDSLKEKDKVVVSMRNVVSQLDSACRRMRSISVLYNLEAEATDKHDELIEPFIRALGDDVCEKVGLDLTCALKNVTDKKYAVLANFCNILIANPDRIVGKFDDFQLLNLKDCHCNSNDHRIVQSELIQRGDLGRRALDAYNRYLEDIYEQGKFFLNSITFIRGLKSD